MAVDLDTFKLKLDAYGRMSVVCALFFGFSLSNLQRDLSEYQDIITTNTAEVPQEKASVCTIIFGALATGTSMVATLEFSAESYLTSKLLEKSSVKDVKDKFSSNNCNKRFKKLAKCCLFLSLLCFCAQISARCWVVGLGTPYLATTVAIVWISFIIVIFSLCSKSSLYKEVKP